MTVRARVLPRWPMLVEGEGGVTVTQSNGRAVIGLPTNLAEQVASYINEPLKNLSDMSETGIVRRVGTDAWSAGGGVTYSELDDNLAARFHHYGTKADLEAATVPDGTGFVALAGYDAIGDGGGPALYKEAETEPPHAAKIQSGDGKWWELAESIVDPRMMGVKFDGVTDDTDAWNDIIAALNGGYYKAFRLPAGSTLISGSLDTITASDWSIYGQGMGVTSFVMDSSAGTSGTVFDIGDASNVARRWIVSGLSIINNNSTSLDGTENPFEVHSSVDGLIDHVRCQATAGFVTIGNSSLGTQSNRLLIMHCQNQAYTPAGGKVFDVQAQAGTKISMSTFGGTGTASPNFRGIYVHPTSDDIMDNFRGLNSEWNYGAPDPLYNVEYDVTQGSIGTQIFVGCVFDQAVSGANIYIHADVGTDANAFLNATFIGCTSNGSTNAQSIYIDNTGDAEMDITWLGGNLSSLEEETVRVVGGNPVGLRIENSTLLCRRTAGSNTARAIYVGDDVSGLRIINNSVFQRNAIGTGNPNKKYNYFVEFEGNASDCVISNNDASECGIAVFGNTDAWDPSSVTTMICKNNVGPNGPEVAWKPQTADDTPVTAATHTLADETTVIAIARGTAIRNNNSSRGYFERKALIYRDGGGGATIQGGADTDVLTVQSDSWAMDIAVDGNDINLNLTGGSFAVYWNIEFEVTTVYAS